MRSMAVRWKLREVMAKYKIKGVDLAEALSLSNNSVSRMKNRDTMPQINGDSLNKLCNALNDIAGLHEVITPGLLIGYEQDPKNPESKTDLLQEEVGNDGFSRRSRRARKRVEKNDAGQSTQDMAA